MYYSRILDALTFARVHGYREGFEEAHRGHEFTSAPLSHEHRYPGYDYATHDSIADLLEFSPDPRSGTDSDYRMWHPAACQAFETGWVDGYRVAQNEHIWSAPLTGWSSGFLLARMFRWDHHQAIADGWDAAVHAVNDECERRFGPGWTDRTASVAVAGKYDTVELADGLDRGDGVEHWVAIAAGLYPNHPGTCSRCQHPIPDPWNTGARGGLCMGCSPASVDPTEAVNAAARFLPMTDAEDTPALEVGGVHVTAYHRAHRVHVAISTHELPTAGAWLTCPIEVVLDEDVIHERPAPTRGSS